MKFYPSSGTIKRFAIAGFVAVCTLIPTACDSSTQKTASALVSVVGTSVASLLILENDPTDAAKLQKDFQAASTAVLNWQQGTPAQDVVQALNILSADLDLIPVSAQDQALIELAIGTTDEIIALFAPTTTSTPVTASPVSLRIAYEKQVARKHHKKLAGPILTAKDFKKQWNAELKKHPELAKAKAK